MAVGHQRQYRPVIAPAPDTAQVCGPAFIGLARNGGQCLDSRTKPHRPFLHLPMLELEYPLHGILVEATQVSYDAVAK